MKLQESAVLPATPERVWELLVDWERQLSWMPDVAWVRRIGSEGEMGAHLAVRTKVFGIPLTTDLIRVTGWEPPRRLAVQHEGFVQGAGEWWLEDQGDGRTRFTWIEELRLPPPILGEVALRIYSLWQRRMLRRSILNLRRLLAQS
jgi:carbon monoxide dehydrogenase subunit G